MAGLLLVERRCNTLCESQDLQHEIKNKLLEVFACTFIIHMCIEFLAKLI